MSVETAYVEKLFEKEIKEFEENLRITEEKSFMLSAFSRRKESFIEGLKVASTHYETLKFVTAADDYAKELENSSESVTYRFEGLKKEDFIPSEELMDFLENLQDKEKSEQTAIKVIKDVLFHSNKEEIRGDYDIGNLDSLDAVEIIMALEEELYISIPDEDAKKIETCKTVNDLAEYIQTNLISLKKN